MIAKKARRLRPGHEFNGLITRNAPQYRQVLSEANTDDTLKLIQEVVQGSLGQTAALAKTLKGSSLTATCRNIWTFIYTHIGYHVDKPGAEEIRDPGRTWADRKNPGVDCDDYAVFTSSLLLNLGIPHFLRVTAYGGDWQHIYVIVPKDGNTARRRDQSRRDYITIDDVTDQFDFEVHYTKNRDIPMTLNHLSGLPDIGTPGDMDGLGKTWFGKAFQAVGKAATFVAKPVAKAVVAVAKTVRTVATTPVRLGILAWMKTDFRKGAQRLRWGYVPYSECAKFTDYGPKAHAEIVDALKRITNTFVNNLGGQANVLKMAIVTGKGNTNREVPSTVANIPGFSGLGAMPDDKSDPDYAFVMGLSGFNRSQRVYHPELQSGMGALGIAEETIIAAATAIMVPLLNLLKGKESDPNDPVPAEYRPAAEPEPEADDQAQLDAMSADAPAEDTTPEPAADDTSLGAVAARKKKAAVRVKAAVVKHAAAGKPVTAVHKTVAKKAAVAAKKPLTALQPHTILRPVPVSLTLPTVISPLPTATVVTPRKKSKAGQLITAVGKSVQTVLHPTVVKKIVKQKAKRAKAAQDAGDHATADQLRKENLEMVKQTVNPQSYRPTGTEGRGPVRMPQADQATVDAADYNPDMDPSSDPVTVRLNKAAAIVDRAQQYTSQGAAIVNQAKAVITRQPQTSAVNNGGYTPYEEVGDGSADAQALVAANPNPAPQTASMGTIAAVGIGAILLGVLFAGRSPAHAPARKSLNGTPPKRKSKTTYSGSRSKKSGSGTKSTKQSAKLSSRPNTARPFSGIDL